MIVFARDEDAATYLHRVDDVNAVGMLLHSAQATARSLGKTLRVIVDDI